MSLLLLFLPHNQVPPTPARTIGPAVMYSIEIARPDLTLVQGATGVFTESTVAYSSSTVSYSSVIETYGGSDLSRPQVQGVTLDSIDLVTPTLYSVDKI